MLYVVICPIYSAFGGKMSVYDPSGSGDVHISKAISGGKQGSAYPVPTGKTKPVGKAKKVTKKVVKKKK